MKKLGVIGGLGPMATVRFLELIIRMTKASCDQEHLDMVIYNYPSIPDRTSFILQKSNQNPIKEIMELGIKLQNEKVDYIAIPCITAHCYFKELEKKIETPIINMVKETAVYLNTRQIHKVGVLATDGTIQTKIFQKQIERLGMEAIIPSEKKQKYVMDLIYTDIKAGRPISMQKFQSVDKELRENGADVIILGCTELSMIKREEAIGPGYIDAMEVLAMKSIKLCGLPVRREFDELITI